MSGHADTYAERGYALIRAAIPRTAIDRLLENFVSLASEVAGRPFVGAHSPEIASFLKERKDVLGKVYDETRRPSWLTDFSVMPSIVEPVREILGNDVALLRKIPFRIDVPFETAEYAVWHQDHYYVRGSESTVTAWIPMQDMEYRNGCIKVMPGSHKLGPLDHENKILGKRDYPSGIFDREVRYVEMAKGDVLLFHSCLLHSSSLNLSESIRFSINARYTKTSEPTDPGMGGIVPLPD